MYQEVAGSVESLELWSGFTSDGSRTSGKSPVLAMWPQAPPYSGSLLSQQPLLHLPLAPFQSVHHPPCAKAYPSSPSVKTPNASWHSAREGEVPIVASRFPGLVSLTRLSCHAGLL